MAEPKAYKNDDEKWEAESDARTLSEAQEIRRDKKRMKRALACLEQQQSDAENALALEKKVSEKLKETY